MFSFKIKRGRGKHLSTDIAHLKIFNCIYLKEAADMCSSGSQVFSKEL
jgi:hypothetical protein